jgi:hypothetical protein
VRMRTRRVAMIYSLRDMVIFFAEISALPPGIHWCPIHTLSSLKTQNPIGLVRST